MSEGGSRSRGRYDDEDDRYGRRSMGRERDDDGRYSRRGGSSEGRGTGGWFGDSEGHSEASRRGWESGSHGESGWYGILRVTLRPHVAAGIIRATAKAVGTVIPKATRKRHAGVGKAAKAGARPATTSVLSATTRCSPAAARGMTMTATTAAAMTMSVAMADVAAGPAIRKATQKLRGAAGKTVAN